MPAVVPEGDEKERFTGIRFQLLPRHAVGTPCRRLPRSGTHHRNLYHSDDEAFLALLVHARNEPVRFSVTDVLQAWRVSGDRAGALAPQCNRPLRPFYAPSTRLAISARGDTDSFAHRRLTRT
jgi:hypothetical protein